MDYAIYLHHHKPHLSTKKMKFLSLATWKYAFRDEAVQVTPRADHAEIINKMVASKNSLIYPKRVTSGRYKSRKKKNQLPTEEPPIPTAEEPLPSIPPIKVANHPNLPKLPDPPSTQDDDLPLYGPDTDPHTPEPERGVEDETIRESIEKPGKKNMILPDDFFREDLPDLKLDFEAEELSYQVLRVNPDGTVEYRDQKPKSKFYSRVHVVDLKFEKNADRVQDKYFFSFAAQQSLGKALSEWPKESLQAMIKEIEGLLERGVWTGVLKSSLSKADRKRTTRSSAFVKKKIDQLNKTEKWKARIVTDGSMQDKTLYQQQDISSPTVQLHSIFTLASIAAAEGLKVKTMDVAQAYLNADMPRNIYVSLDPKVAKILVEEVDGSYAQYLDSEGKILVKLNKAQYGCVESARLWYSTFSKFLVSKGFEVNPLDPCVLTRVNEFGEKIYAAIYVDDIFAIGDRQEDLDIFQGELEEIFGKMAVTDGSKHQYLGVLFDFSIQGKVKITMEKFLTEIIEDNLVTSVAETPAAENLLNTSKSSPLLSHEESEKFHRTVCQLLYAAIRARPDIALPVIFLTSRVTKATLDDAHKLRRVLRYVSGTRDLGITLGADETGELRIITYADASFGVHMDGKSHSGMYMSFGRGPIWIKSIKQKTVTKSSTEAELVALSDASSLTQYHTSFLDSLGYDVGPAKLYQDNMSTMNLAMNGRSNSDRTKHIKLRYFFIKQFTDNGELELEYCPTDLMIADILTKPLQGATFKRLRDLLLGVTTN